MYREVFKGLTIMEIPDEMLKEIRESGYDQELVFTQIRKLLDSDKPIKEKEYNLELIDNYLLDKKGISYSEETYTAEFNEVKNDPFGDEENGQRTFVAYGLSLIHI